MTSLLTPAETSERPRPRYFVLDEQRQVVPATFDEWGDFTDTHRNVAKSRVGEQRVSTIFVGIRDASDDPVPMVFETMVFGGPHDLWRDCYPTWEEAEAGHREVVARLSRGEAPPE